ncbi:glycerol dehydratase [Salmonella sp. NCTC 11881]|nr:glycerol dehydratase [Salmonella sp. NCTC 11881]
MVKSDRLQMAMIAREIEQKLNIDVQIGGAEAEAAILGALTTPGTTRPLGDPRPRRGLHRCLHHQP